MCEAWWEIIHWVIEAAAKGKMSDAWRKEVH